MITRLVFLLVLFLYPLIASSDEYWRGWCAGRVAASERLEAQYIWFDRLLTERYPMLAPETVPHITKDFLWQSKLFLSPATPTGTQVIPFDNGMEIECPSGEIRKPGGEQRQG